MLKGQAEISFCALHISLDPLVSIITVIQLTEKARERVQIYKNF